MICTLTGLAVSITGLYPVYYFPPSDAETELLADQLRVSDDAHATSFRGRPGTHRHRPRADARLRHEPADLLHHHRGVRRRRSGLDSPAADGASAARRQGVEEHPIEILEQRRDLGRRPRRRRARRARQRRAHARGEAGERRDGRGRRSAAPTGTAGRGARPESASAASTTSPSPRRSTGERTRHAVATPYPRSRRDRHRPRADARLRDEPADLLHHHDVVRQGGRHHGVQARSRSPPRIASPATS